jgi:hypothetical protein
MNRNRKTVIIVLFTAMLLAIIAFPALVRSNAFAATNSAEFVIGLNKYFINDQLPGVNMDAAPYIDSGRTLVPVRYLADALVSQTAWDGNTQEVTVTSGSTTISMTIGSTTLSVNGQAQTMDVAPVIKDGRTYLPARYVAEALGYSVDWNAQYQVVIIWPQGTPEPDYSNATAQAQQKPTVVDGLNIPTGTHLIVDTTTPADYNAIEFQIKGSNGDLQGQIADAQNILSQSQYLDPATIAAAMATINYDLKGQPPMPVKAFNSPNGGSVKVTPLSNDSWVGVQVWSIQLPSSEIATK